MELCRITDRIICLKMELDGVMLNIISAYMPQVGFIREEKEAFWLDLMRQWKRYQRMKELWWEQT